ncbi:OLC1v1016867C1 [Oldenlandia corymbosa var. corymbosa]|uniref:OLC1v1016867C1 n=1 Tax=Oldenlandia corymbosa var. corymbosa TaxID=529605 RepID=A0AAV1E845_OLDCO|nr:OLC1v1016867C1 [Oldenlandia corymbosa var. corymbosa]
MVQFLLLLLGMISPLYATAANRPTNIFILAGQSNMAGRGGVRHHVWDGIIPPECKQDPFIFRLNAKLTWEPAKEPLHKDIDLNETTGIGPGMAFANTVLNNDSGFGTIGLVPCAVGGTSIREWEHGTLLYNQLVNRTNVARKGGGRIRAILWYQGESDSITRQDATSYEKNLKRFFTNLRVDLRLPVVPIIQVALPSISYRYDDIVRQTQGGMKLQNLLYVDANGLELQDDQMHLTTQSQVRLGKRLADAFLQFQSS